MDPGGVGDAMFDIVTFIVLARPEITEALAFIVLVVLATALITAYIVAVQSLAFWTGRAETIADQALFGLITFSTYPERLFGGPVRIVLFTGVVSYVPVRLIQSWDWPLAAAHVIVVAGSVVVAVTTFEIGLGRYQSGSSLSTWG
jgi:ABC-type uncharacterized transport system permease subunit